MANLTFLDMMLAEALASGLAREARRQERPPPDNFFLLPPDPDAWRKIRDASKKENMVVCIEFTNNNNEFCRRVQEVFMDMAREFDGIPFVRAEIIPGIRTYDEMRSDLGGVEYTPSILVVFYGEGSVSRAKFERVQEIRDGLSSGRIKGVIKELIERRVKLKMAERVTVGLLSQLSERERKLRQEYEAKLERQLKEQEEELKKKEEERRKKEEEEKQERNQQRLFANKKLQEQREKHMDELLRMNLESASARELKDIMEKMGVSDRGCLSKADLREKLINSIPELKFRKSAQSRSRNNSDNGDPLGGSIDEPEPIMPSSNKLLKKKDDEIASLRRQVKELEAENKRLRMAANSSRPNASSNESAKVKQLETSLLETRMLYTTSLQDFDILGLIHDNSDGDCDSIILRAKCAKPGIPNGDRVYAMKVLTDFFIAGTQTQVRQRFQNEYQVLCQLPPHENIIHMWAFFYDRPTPDVVKLFKKAGNDSRGMSLFILMEEHPTSMADHLKILVDNKGPKSTKVVSWLKDLLSGLTFLEQHNVVHRDLKLSNLLLTSSGKMVISDFGKAIEMDEGCGFRTKHTNGFDIGGNHAHLAPEVLNSRPPRNTLDYSKQPVWAAGVLAYELAGHPSPFASGQIDQRGYVINKLPRLEATHCKYASSCERLPGRLTKLVQSMLEPDPSERLSLLHCLDTINNMS